jgi:hypothetical protein
MFFYPVVPVEVPSVGIGFYGRGYDFFRCNNIFVLLKFFIGVILDCLLFLVMELGPT